MFQRPEAYVEEFLREVFGRSLRRFEQAAVPGTRYTPDFVVGDVVVEAEAPCQAQRGRGQLEEYLKAFGLRYGVVVDVPSPRYFGEYPRPCGDPVGFDFFVRVGDSPRLVFSKRYRREELERAREELRTLLEVLSRLNVAVVEPRPEAVLAKVKDLVERWRRAVLEALRKRSGGRAAAYFSAWLHSMELAYGARAVEEISNREEFFAELTAYVTFLKALGATLLRSAIGGGSYTIPMELSQRGWEAAVELFWRGGAGAGHVFERDEYDWVFDPEVAGDLDGFFREVGRALAEVDWGKPVDRDLLKRVYQNVVSREVRRVLGEFYTPDWLAKLILWKALRALARGEAPREPVAKDVDSEIVELLDGYWKANKRLPSFVDPTCGSFTFGVQYLSAVLDWYFSRGPSVNAADLAEALMDSAVGIDINPVAVVTAKVNYLLQLHALLASRRAYLAREPILPIYRLDLTWLHASASAQPPGTLLAYTKERAVILRVPVGSIEKDVEKLEEAGLRVKSVKAGDGALKYLEVRFPETVLEKLCRADRGLRALKRAFLGMKERGVKGFAGELEKCGVELEGWEREAIEELDRAVRKLEELGLDTVWLSLLSNYVLAHLASRRKFDLVVGNLPWVNVSSYPKGYAEWVKAVMGDLGVAPPGQALKKADVSVALFAVSARYLARDGGAVALMVPASIFRGLHGAGWRKFTTTELTTLEYLDLEQVKPFEGVDNQPGAVVSIKRQCSGPAEFRYAAFRGTELSPEAFGREPGYEQVLGLLSKGALRVDVSKFVSVEIGGEVAWLSENTYSTARKLLRTDGSEPEYEAHAGAAFTTDEGIWMVVGEPRSVECGPGYPAAACVEVTTRFSEERGFGSFVVEKDYLFEGFKGEDVDVGRVKRVRYFIAPYRVAGRRPIPLSEWELKKTLLWRNYLSREDVRGTLGKVTAHLKREWWHIARFNENALAEVKVVWRDVAKEFVPAVVSGRLIPDYTVNYVVVGSEDEGHYLAAVLLSEQVNAVVRELGPWVGHVQPRFLRYFKIPRYDPENPAHRELSELGRRAAAEGRGASDVRARIGELVDLLAGVDPS